MSRATVVSPIFPLMCTYPGCARPPVEGCLVEPDEGGMAFVAFCAEHPAREVKDDDGEE